MMSDTPQSRLRDFIDEHYHSPTVFAKILGVSPGTINTYINTDRVYQNKSALRRLAETGINIEWYLHGIGEPFNKEALSKGAIKVKEKNEDYIADKKDEIYRVPKEFQGMLANIKLHIMSASAATGTLTDLRGMMPGAIFSTG